MIQNTKIDKTVIFVSNRNLCSRHLGISFIILTSQLLKITLSSLFIGENLFFRTMRNTFFLFRPYYYKYNVIVLLYYIIGLDRKKRIQEKYQLRGNFLNSIDGFQYIWYRSSDFRKVTRFSVSFYEEYNRDTVSTSH